MTLQYIWIDSICIDHENNADRNHQVKLMKHIYSKAVLVVAWLGLNNSFTKSVLQDIHKFRKSPRFSSARVFGPKSRSLELGFDLEYFHRM